MHVTDEEIHMRQKCTVQHGTELDTRNTATLVF